MKRTAVGSRKAPKGYRDNEREARRPARRLTEISSTRQLWDGRHPGPIYSEIVPTHICLEWPIEFQYDPNHPLVRDFESSENDQSSIMMFFRIVTERVVERRNINFQSGESKNPFVWKPDLLNPVYSLLDQTITIRELESDGVDFRTESMQVVEWFRKNSHYKSGHCVLR
jgi:hypothetical protein